jgi:autophagy-related protein 17
MDNLRSTIVEASFRPEAEESRSLLDFVDEQDVETMRDKLKESIRESNVRSPPYLDDTSL